MFGVIQMDIFYAYTLYYLRIARIRNGRFLAEVLSDITRKKERAADFSTALNCCTEATIRSHWEGHFASLSHG
jgi:hypothetical protein